MRLSRRYPVPADLALLYEFVNSLDERRFVQAGDKLAGGDELATVEQLEQWMRQRGLLDGGVRLDAKCHGKALELRRALRAVLQREPSDRASAELAAAVNAVAVNYPVHVQMSAKGAIRLQPAPGVRSGGLGAILAELFHAADTGRLDRLKVCGSEECQWAFYDRSKPATRRWCSSTLCGNRQKTRAYRRRQNQR